MKQQMLSSDESSGIPIIIIFIIIAAFCIYNLLIASEIVKRFNKGGPDNNNQGYNKQEFKDKFNIDISSVEKTYILYSAMLMFSIFIVVFVGSQYLPVSGTVQQISNQGVLILLVIVSIIFVSYSINTFRNSKKDTEAGDITKGIVTVSGCLLAILVLLLGFLIYNIVNEAGLIQKNKPKKSNQKQQKQQKKQQKKQQQQDQQGSRMRSLFNQQ